MQEETPVARTGRRGVGDEPAEAAGRQYGLASLGNVAAADLKTGRTSRPSSQRSRREQKEAAPQACPALLRTTSDRSTPIIALFEGVAMERPP